YQESSHAVRGGVVGPPGKHLGGGPVLRVQPAIRQARNAALHAHPAGRAGDHLHRRVRGHAPMGRSFHLAVFWPGRLDHEAVQMAAPAAHPGRRAGRHHRTLPLYIDRTLRVELDAATDRGPAVRARYPRPDATIVAGHPQPRRPKADADKLPATDVSSLAT